MNEHIKLAKQALAIIESVNEKLCVLRHRHLDASRKAA